MKRSLLAAALLAATATTALAASASNIVTLRTAGYWTSFYSPANSGGKAMCGMSQILGPGNGPQGMFMVKYSGEGVFVHVFKTSWSIPAGTEIPIWLQFDRSEPLTTTGSGGPGDGRGSFVEFNIKTDFTKDFLNLFANANAMSVGFQQGSEKPWAVNMSGSREVAESFRKCATMLAQGTTTQPYGSAQPSQPYGSAQPSQPSQPFGGSQPAAKANDGGI